MKTSFYLTTVCLISLSIFLFFAKPYTNDHDISIAVHEGTGTYTFTASYPAQNAGRVWKYVSDHIAQTELGSHGVDHFEGNIILKDKTVMFLKESPGQLKINIDKCRNSPGSLSHVKSICAGIKTLLAVNNL